MSSIKTQYRNIRFANDSDSQQMDIFLPEGKGPFPAIILIHGGGFKSGDKKAKYSLAKKLVANGYVAICVNYRLSGEAIFPAAVHDLKASIRFIRGNAKKYNIDPNNIGSWGSSAGGNLSAILGTSSGNKFLDGDLGSFKNMSTKIQVCVDWFGPIDFSTLKEDAKKLGLDNDFNVDIESKYVGKDVSDPKNIRWVQLANPATYIDETDPPFYIQVGDQDNLVPYLQSKDFVDKLRQVLGRENVDFDLIEGGGHGGTEFSKKENIDRIIAFLDKNLK